MEKDILIAMVEGDRHLGDNLKKRLINYINNIEQLHSEFDKRTHTEGL